MLFNIPPSRWLYAVYMTPALVGLRFAYVYSDPTFSLIGAFMAASSFVMIGENALSVAKREDKRPEVELSDTTFRELAQLRHTANQPKEQHPGDAWKPKGILTGEKNVLASNILSVKIDHEREFCKTLVSMKQVDGKMDVSETYWLKGGHWLQISSQLTPTDFYGMRNKFEYWHIVGKKGNASNSPYIVLNEDAIVKRAEGKLRLPLPQGL